ncbi:MAG: isoprenylcysteine carboxylmethyltransferase family protein [Myxococcota bacterium]
MWLVVRLWPAGIGPEYWYQILLVVSEGLVAAFLVFRRSTASISMRPWDWAIAVAGTFLPLLVVPGGDSFLHPVGPLLILLGTLIHLGAKLSLRRSFGLVAANRGVQKTGMYRLVRHPMYAGYMLTHLGFVCAAPAWWNVTVYAAAWLLLVLRILAEERLLLKDEAYASYAGSVRFRLLPFVF